MRITSSYDLSVKSTAVIVLLIAGVILPTFISRWLLLLGIILMWFWTKWPKWLKILITLPLLIIFILSFFIVFYLLYFRPFQMKGNAMAPTYKNNAFVMTRVIGKDQEIKKDDIVIFEMEPKGTVYIKRVAGLPGNIIESQTVPPNKYYVLGDNLAASRDSRHFGFVEKNNIISKVLFCYWNCR